MAKIEKAFILKMIKATDEVLEPILLELNSPDERIHAWELFAINVLSSNMIQEGNFLMQKYKSGNGDAWINLKMEQVASRIAQCVQHQVNFINAQRDTRIQ